MQTWRFHNRNCIEQKSKVIVTNETDRNCSVASHDVSNFSQERCNVVWFLAIDDDISRKLHLLSPYKTMLFKEQPAQIHQNKYLARFCHLFSLKFSAKIFLSSHDNKRKSDEERYYPTAFYCPGFQNNLRPLLFGFQESRKALDNKNRVNLGGKIKTQK